MELALLIVHILLSILLIVLIVVAIKFIGTINKINEALDDILYKLREIQPGFNLISNVTNSVINFSQSSTYGFMKIFSKFVNRK